jgi:periplasmic copper chaperone A
MKAVGYIVASTAAALLGLAPVASGHVTVQPEEIPAGGFTRIDVRVPTERDDASTTKVEIQLPPGFLSVSTEPVPGWDAEIVNRKLDKPVEQFGEKVTEEVGQVSFTARGEAAGIGPGEFQDFGLSVSVPDRAGSTLTFKAVQTYSSGEVVRWIGPPDSEQPAPQVKLAAAEAEGGASEPAAGEEQASAPAESGGDDDSGNTLAIIALVVAIAGLAAGLLALLGARGRSREMARMR